MKNQIEFVVMDIGSSGEPPALFNSIRDQVFLIGFEPDSREQSSQFGAQFKRSMVVPKIVVADENINEAEFILTKSPYCSSMLEPDLKALDNYSFKSLFDPVRKVKLPATSLNRLMKEKNIEHLDWLKVDAQGADLQIIKSMSSELLSQVLVIEVEPGLIDAYKGEDLFPAVHEFMLKNQFWLADLKYQSYPRISEDSLAKAQSEFGSFFSASSLAASPTAAEARYFRTKEYFETCSARNCQAGFTFALMSQLPGFAAEIYFICKRRFPREAFLVEMSQELKKATLPKVLNAEAWTQSPKTLKQVLKNRTPRFVKDALNSVRNFL